MAQDDEDIYRFDKQNYRKKLQLAPQQIRQGYNQDLSFVDDYAALSTTTRVVMCGMGGSAIPSKILTNYLDDCDITVVQDYDFPFSLRGEDLVIINSYSGNTEEAVSCYRKARRQNANVVVVTTGGRLGKSIKKSRVPHVELPSGYPPRAALYTTFFTLLKLLETVNLTRSHVTEVELLEDYLQTHNLEDHGKKLAEKTVQKLPVVYTSQKYEPVAYRWRTQFNENAKTMCIHHTLPEANHNEILGYRGLEADTHTFLITMDDDHQRVKKRFTLTKKSIRKQGQTASEIRFKGKMLVKMFSAINLGDWTSYYAALQRSVDPSNIEEIESFKESMGKFV